MTIIVKICVFFIFMTLLCRLAFKIWYNELDPLEKLYIAVNRPSDNKFAIIVGLMTMLSFPAAIYVGIWIIFLM